MLFIATLTKFYCVKHMQSRTRSRQSRPTLWLVTTDINSCSLTWHNGIFQWHRGGFLNLKRGHVTETTPPCGEIYLLLLLHAMYNLCTTFEILIHQFLCALPTYISCLQIAYLTSKWLWCNVTSAWEVCFWICYNCLQCATMASVWRRVQKAMQICYKSTSCGKFTKYWLTVTGKSVLRK